MVTSCRFIGRILHNGILLFFSACFSFPFFNCSIINYSLFLKLQQIVRNLTWSDLFLSLSPLVLVYFAHRSLIASFLLRAILSAWFYASRSLVVFVSYFHCLFSDFFPLFVIDLNLLHKFRTPLRFAMIK